MEFQAIIQEKEPQKRASLFYRRLRPEYFSDSEVKYEVPLTEELFRLHLSQLSTLKLHGAFENFIVKVAQRLITPNIKPQSGPDGGGDGKVDAETYEVSEDVSANWIVPGGGASKNEKWAFAISCKSDWKQKVKSDVKKIVETGRDYTRILFFSNQPIKSSTRFETEGQLSAQYGIRVEIFDQLWCQRSVFQNGCLDVALSELNFSTEYLQKHEVVGERDRWRRKRLSEIENALPLHSVGDLDTGYIEDLRETYVLSRELERPRQETEGRFDRAIRSCNRHGTVQQMFNIIYDHAWTSYFWFDDPKAAHSDCQKLKEFVETDCSVVRLEKYTNLITVLVQAARFGLIQYDQIRDDVEYLVSLRSVLEKDSTHLSGFLFLQIQLEIQSLIASAAERAPIIPHLKTLQPLLLQAVNHIDISSESLYAVMEMLSRQFRVCKKFDDLVDEFAERIAKSRSDAEAARVRLNRARDHFANQDWKGTVRHLGFCIYVFEKDEYKDELLQSTVLMGVALWEMKLPYSAESFLINAIFFLVQSVRNTGVIPHQLITLLRLICEIELMLGRLVSYLNWHELLMVMARNADCDQDDKFVTDCRMADAAWTCRFAACDIGNHVLPHLPDVLGRAGFLLVPSS